MMTPIKKVQIALILSSFVVLFFLYGATRRVGIKIKNLQVEVSELTQKTKKVQSSLPWLRESAKKVVAVAGKQYATPAKLGDWCERVILRFSEWGVSVDSVLRGPHIPLELKQPWSFVQIREDIPPELAPYEIDLEFRGNIYDINSFFFNLRKKEPYVLATRLDANLIDEGDDAQGDPNYDVTARVVFPQLIHQEALEALRDFAEGEDLKN